MWVYFMLMARFWELSSGALLGIVYSNWAASPVRCIAVDGVPLSPVLAGGTQLIALAMLVIAVILPAWQRDAFAVPILLCVIATNLLLISVLFGRAPLVLTLKTQPVLLIGVLSYSLYLWHWPVFMLFRQTVGLSLVSAVPCLVVIALLSWLSYRFVETPWRAWRTPTFNKLASAFALAFCVAIAPAVLLQFWPGSLYAGKTQDWPGDWLPSRLHAYGGDTRLQARNCNLGNGTVVPDVVPNACRLAAEGVGNAGRRRLLLVGDSHAFSDWSMVIDATRTLGTELLVLSHDGCGPAAYLQMTSCGIYLRQIPELMRRHLGAGDIVMVVHRWSDRADPGYVAMMRHLEMLTIQAKSLGVLTVIEAPLPEFERPSFLCLPEWFRTNYDGCDEKRSALAVRSHEPLRLAAELAARHPNTLRVWQPVDSLCDFSHCRSFRNGRPLFRDHNHLSVNGSKLLSPVFKEWLERQWGARPL